MKTFFVLTKRNIKAFFKDKGLFLSSLVSPLILLLLFITFLGDVYRDSFTSVITAYAPGFTLEERLLEGAVGGWLISSLLTVSCVTISFCANMQMVTDKVTGCIQDFLVSPVKKSTLSLAYYFGTVAVTCIVCFTVFAVGLIYLAIVGWYLTFTDVLLCIVDVFITVLFGTALSSIVSYFLSSQGGISAVATLVSSVYGFLCGAYMPISSFSSGIAKFISFLPGTYATGLFRNHFMGGALESIEAETSAQLVDGLKDGFDCNLYFFDHAVSQGAMYAIICITVVVLIGVYVLINLLRKKRK